MNETLFGVGEMGLASTIRDRSSLHALHVSRQKKKKKNELMEHAFPGQLNAY